MPNSVPGWFPTLAARAVAPLLVPCSLVLGAVPHGPQPSGAGSHVPATPPPPRAVPRTPAPVATGRYDAIDAALEGGSGLAAGAALTTSPTTAPAALEDPAPAKPAGPWRLDDALGTPDWLTVKGHQRTRYENLDHQFRLGRTNSAQIVSLRTAIELTARHEGWHFTTELMDSRALGADSDTLVATSIVNALEPIQIQGGYTTTGIFDAGDRLEVKLGRFTQDIGSRRLMARNRFRNTINTFDGVYGSWQNEAGDSLEAFYTNPVRRLPLTQQELRDNDIEFDEERNEARWYGLIGTLQDVALDSTGELYALGIDERDGPNFPTRNRQFWTFGGRLDRAPAAGDWHHEVEAAFQTGESRRLSSSSDFTDLDHQAWFAHLGVGYTWESEMNWRLEGLFDYASGDKDPNDGENNRFDTLFGARRWEFGPTSIYGPFARGNLMTPGYRVTLNPSKNTNLMFTHRLHYLASDRDDWVGTGVTDPTGNSGDELGQFLETRLRYDVVPKNFRIELGIAHHIVGSFIEDAPNSTYRGNTTYVYAATILTF